jgi:hypothetical protein
MNETQEIRKRFLHSLKLGTGETYLLQKKYPEIDFSREIIKGAVQNFAYDSQSEGSRSKYIYGLIKKSKSKDKTISKVFDKIIETKEDDWGLYQLLDIAVLIYKDGNTSALEIIKTRFEKNGLDGFDFCGQEQLMEIGGIDGVLKVAEIVGERLTNDKDDYEYSWKIDEFQKKNKSIDVYGILKEKSKKNEFIKAYYESIIQNKFKPYRRVKPIKFSYELIKEKIQADKFRYISKTRANDLSEEEVLKLAEEFIKSRKNKEKENYLRFFAKRKFPYDYQILFKIAQRKNPRKTRLVEYAVESLTFFKDKKIRELAVKKIKEVKNPCDYLPLLVSNYRKGDFELLKEVIDRSNNFDFIHSLINGILDIYKSNSLKECKEPLEAMYSKMNCGLHRIDIVELLYENKVLSNKILLELQFDSDERIRKLYRTIKKNGR